MDRPPRSVAFIGLGVMGYPMAGHLARAGHRVAVHNRTAAKAQAWVAEHGGRAAPTPREAANGADIVFACVGNDDDLRSVVLGPDGAFAGMAAGTVLVDHTTASAEVARELAVQARQRGLAFIDAPVSGGNVGAVAGTLTVLCGGDEAPFDTMRPVLAGAYAKAVTRLGPSGSGQLAKMMNQIAAVGVIQGLAESLAFGRRAGLDLNAALAAMRQGAAQSWQMDHRGSTMAEGRFDFGFAVDLMRKDLALVMEEARRNGAALPVTELIDGYYAELQARGGGRLDITGLIKRLS